MATETPAPNKETKRRPHRNLDDNLTMDHTQGHVHQPGPKAGEENTYIRVKRSGSLMGAGTTDDEELLLPMQNDPASKDITAPDDFDDASPSSDDDGQTPLLSTPWTTVTPSTRSRKLQDVPLPLTTASRKAARDRFVAGLQAGILNGTEPGRFEIPSLPPTPTKTEADDAVKKHREELEAIENRLSVDLIFDPNVPTRDDLETKPLEQLPERYRNMMVQMRHEWAVNLQIAELNRKIIKSRSWRPKFVVFPSGNVKDGNAEEESRFVNERLKKGQIHVVSCLNCELKGMSCPLRRPTPGFPMMNRYPHCPRCEREGKSHLCLTMRTATDEEKEAEDWQVKLLRTQYDDDERWGEKLKYLEEVRNSTALLAWKS